MLKRKPQISPFQSFRNFSLIRKVSLLILCTYIVWLTLVSLPNNLETLHLEKTPLSRPVEVDDSNINNEIDLEIIGHDEKINLKYCGEKVCNFMFPYFIPEQETRANLHLRSLTYLARSLNRTMVLPNVGNSRMNSCAPFSFEFYYDLEELRKMFPDIKFITQQNFKEWTKELSIKPDTLHTWFIEDGRNDSYSVRDHEQIAIEPSLRYGKNVLSKLCVDQFDLNITDYNEFHTGIRNVNNFENVMANFFTENLKDKKSPVILIRNRSRKQMFPLIDEPIPYAPHIIKQADELKNKLQPYFCVHWRMEQGIPEKMPECAEKLIETINRLKETEKIDNVYLATDFPISGGKSASETFYGVGKYHRTAIQMLNSTLKINTWVSLNAFEEFRNNEKYASEFSSSGIHGILDKLTCIQADYFLSGPKDCCRIRSTYTRLIGKERQDLIDNGDKRIRNDITRW